MQRLYTIRKSIKIGIMEGCRMKDLIEKSAIKKEGKSRKKELKVNTRRVIIVIIIK